MEDFFSQVKLLFFFIWTHVERTMIYIWINIWLTVLWNSVFLQVRVCPIVQCTLVCPSLPTFILQDIFLSILFRCLSDQTFPALHSEKSTVACFRGWKRRWSSIWTLMRFQDTYGHWDPPPLPWWKRSWKTPHISEAKASLGESREVCGNIMKIRRVVKKNWYFTVRLTVSVDPHTPLLSAKHDFFWSSSDLILKRHF